MNKKLYRKAIALENVYDLIIIVLTALVATISATMLANGMTFAALPLGFAFYVFVTTVINFGWIQTNKSEQ